LRRTRLYQTGSSGGWDCAITLFSRLAARHL
jgi:hypothetical protein